MQKIALFIVIIIIPFSLYGCSCEAMTKEDYLDQADLVVLATLVEVGGYLKTDHIGRQMPFHFKVEEWHKGQSADRIIVISSKMSSACGIGEHMNQKYMLYCQKEIPFEMKKTQSLIGKELFYTSRCQGSKYLWNKKKVPKLDHSDIEVEDRSRDKFYLLTGILLLIVLIFFGKRIVGK